MSRVWAGRLLIAALTLLLVSGCAPRKTAGTAEARPNVLLVVIDALRADRLECYGYSRRTSPNLNALAADGVVFRNAMAQAPETAVSIPSLMTGRWPWEHGAGWQRRGGTVYLRKGAELPTLASVLKEHGYATAAFCANPLIGSDTNVERGFDVFDYPVGELPVWWHGSAADVSAAASRWLDRHGARKGPFFLYLHYIDPHNLYRPPEEFCVFGRPGYTVADDALNAAMNEVFDEHVDAKASRASFREHGVSPSRVRRLSDLYDGEVLCADHYLGQFLQRLKQARLYDNTIIIVTADHGEAFLDHGQLEHGGSLYQELLHVPLIVKFPGLRPGQQVDELVESIDVAPTLLDAVGASQGARMSGESFYRELLRGERLPRRIGMAELPAKHMRAMRVGNLKLIQSPDRVELYDLSTDPKERRNLEQVRPADVARLESVLQQEVARHPAAAGAARPASQQEIEDLRALGYVK